MRIIGTPIASGPVTGRPESRYYRYGGDKPLAADPEPAARKGAAARTANREARKTRFKAILASRGHADLSARIPPSEVIRAGEQTGVSAKIARIYLAELRRQQAEQQACTGHDWQPEDGDPGGLGPMRCYTCGTTEDEVTYG